MTMLAHGRRFARLAAAAGGLALAVGTAACAGADEEAQKAEAAARAEQEAHRQRPRPAEVVLQVVREEALLDAAQEQELEAIAAELEDDREDLEALREELRARAAEAVRAGEADRAELEQAVDEGLQAIEDRVLRTMDGLEDLHAMLDPEQRADVAAGLRTRLEEHRAMRAARVEKKREDGLGKVASYLLLSRAQIDQLLSLRKELVGEERRVFPDRGEIEALIDAFESDDFRPALDALHAKKSKILRMRVARASDRADEVLAIFTPAQRDLLADLIVEGPSKVLLGQEAEEAEAAR